ncbi:hypothetical protein PYW08_002782 [Mythimna loreyi]|uniref:Uncharacterized protein n=1 Tax=Mythimna loreyi TaxID=667449 RepID=A0ACC2QLF0_9NEOP|nr:hypothetical protein PYW08_002782 [Mythimna loreyi]
MSRRLIYSDSEKLCLQKLIRKYSLYRNSSVFGNLSAKKSAWARLTQEFNSIESNSRRTESQLRKCWDNIKTRKKVLLNEKRERMKSEGSLCPGSPTSQSEIPPVVVEDPLEAKDVELRFSTDSDTKIMPDEDPVNGNNIREQGITPEFEHQQNTHNTSYNHKKSEEREEELHRLKVSEMQWLVTAAEETYLKAKFDRLSSEERLRFAKTMREEAEKRLNNKD